LAFRGTGWLKARNRNRSAGRQPLNAAPVRPLSGLDTVGFGKSDAAFMRAIDDALAAYLGSREHRSMMSRFGFSEAEIDLIAS
jgi:hypothetical protein